MKKWGAVLIVCCSLMGCNQKKSQPQAQEQGLTIVEEYVSDSDMKASFSKDKEDFEKMAAWMMEDRISYIPLFSSEIDNGKTLDISEERQAMFDKLIKKHSIKRIVFGNATRFNSVVFYMIEAKDGDKTVNRGYEYRHKPEVKYEEWVETDGDLFIEARKHPLNTFITKPIDQNWNLLILIQ